MKRNLLFCLPVLVCFALSGCVTSGTYQKKELEARNLDKSLQEQRGQYNILLGENDQLKNDIKRLTAELASMTGERNALATDKKGLEETLKSTSDAKNQKIGELSQKVGDLTQKTTDLEAENKRLKDEVARLQKQKEEVQQTSKTYGDLLEQMKGEIAKGQVTISELKGKLTVNMVDSVLFDSGKAEVKPEGLVVLQKVVDILKNVKDKAVRIEGHTDNVQIVGQLAKRYPTNWELSAARAINVTRYLQQQGLDPALLGAVAYGEFKPVAPNDTDEGRAKNRRIEIVLVAKE
ncbi:OmpA family protein [Geomonas subterranea]|uniref:OmpA family protein n=1 Tax=Geomonas subterranea TaxID=2847989 RepID=A0ABX8LD08_9BACT|nr:MULTISPECIES: OmpA family protein [Geomonas]QXE89216.1 OmpA family protein [Geomonas subterranea]QXM08672.1 OmpA family protein [Geomonas subterranea]